MIVKLSIPYNTIINHVPTYLLHKTGDIMIACPLCRGRIVIKGLPEDAGSCILDPICSCDVEAAIRDLIYVPDRKRRRLEYLEKKAYDAATMVFGKGALLAAIIATVACFGIAGQMVVDLQAESPISLRTTYSQLTVLGHRLENRHDYDVAENIASGLFLLGWLGVAGTLGLCHLVNKAAYERKPIQYVPPVTIENLPVKELLVRGAEAPSVPQNELLLRATQPAETPQEEMLHISGA